MKLPCRNYQSEYFYMDLFSILRGGCKLDPLLLRGLYPNKTQEINLPRFSTGLAAQLIGEEKFPNFVTFTQDFLLLHQKDHLVYGAQRKTSGFEQSLYHLQLSDLEQIILPRFILNSLSKG